jgi:hypothetical protein
MHCWNYNSSVKIKCYKKVKRSKFNTFLKFIFMFCPSKIRYPVWGTKTESVTLSYCLVSKTIPNKQKIALIKDKISLWP